MAAMFASPGQRTEDDKKWAAEQIAMAKGIANSAQQEFASLGIVPVVAEDEKSGGGKGKLPPHLQDDPSAISDNPATSKGRSYDPALAEFYKRRK